ncbi:MAG: hypothetical protein ACK529_07850, partial [Alphaproteobacteria bacterium]
MQPKTLQAKQYRTHPPTPPRDYSGEVYAALDLGTNNCRLLVAKPYFQQHTQHKTLKVVDSYSRIVRLGEGV